MEQKAFELIQEKLQAALNEQGFGEAVALETDNGRGVMFTTGQKWPTAFSMRRSAALCAAQRDDEDPEGAGRLASAFHVAVR